ncbi:MAG: hypothetical protein HQM10_20905 [Candidatus Riflebacteria bacterium]|nr:hypothetical protein [Candidatus Riflebacteria bacterium]
MNCNEYLQWLDEGGTGECGPQKKSEYLNHAAGCPSCAKALKAHEKITNGIRAFVPGENTLKKFNKNLNQRISAEKSSIQKIPESGNKLVIIIALALSLAVAAALFNYSQSVTTPQQTITSPVKVIEKIHVASIRGIATITCDGKHIAASNDSADFNLLEKYRVVLSSGKEVTINYQDGRWAKIKGDGEFFVMEGALNIGSNSLQRIAFSKTQPGSKKHRVILPTAILGVVGTTIVVQAKDEQCSVFVEEGKITWQAKSGNASGTLSAGESTKINLTATTSDTTSSISTSSQTFPVADTRNSHEQTSTTEIASNTEIATTTLATSTEIASSPISSAPETPFPPPGVKDIDDAF